MRDNIAFLELKFGNIYGGYANFFAISDISLLVFDPSTNRIFIESLAINTDVDVVWVNSKTNELGHTIGRSRQVINLRTRRKRSFNEEFSLNEHELDRAFRNIRPTRRYIKSFFFKNFRKYNIRNIVTFDGKRDIFLCEKSGVEFRGTKIFDLQKALNKEFNYLFSLNKLGVAINSRFDDGYLQSNNQKYWIHPIAARQLRPRTAAWDAARMFLIYQEFNDYHDDFTMKSALLVNKIQKAKEAEEAAKAAEEAANPTPPPPPPPVVKEEVAVAAEPVAEAETAVVAEEESNSVADKKTKAEIKKMLEPELVAYANEIGIEATEKDLKKDTLNKVLDKLGYNVESA
ncbi:MAG: hypothetical protein AB8G86_01940 [Saprospiraceae bacterium]